MSTMMSRVLGERTKAQRGPSTAGASVTAAPAVPAPPPGAAEAAVTNAVTEAPAVLGPPALTADLRYLGQVSQVGELGR